jgi:hypothetical protein
MAISIDTVYQRVLALANKEQRGYITPQEFNLLANQAQGQIFESYFYAKNLRDRGEEIRGTELDETDITELISRKLGPFLSVEGVMGGHTFPLSVIAGGEQCDVFQTGRVFYGGTVCQKIDISEARRFQRSVRHAYPADTAGPIYIDNLTTNRDILVYGYGLMEKVSGVAVECFRVPTQANWAYVVVNEKALYNSNVAVNFELHKAEEDTLVNKILELAGIVINKPGLAQLANQRDATEQQFQNI